MATQAPFSLPKQWRIPSLQLGTYWPELLAVLVALECTGVVLIARRSGVAAQIMWGTYYLLWLIPAAIALLITLGWWLWHLTRKGEPHPIAATIRKLRAIDRRSYAEIFVPVIVMAPFMATFTTFKTLLESFSSSTADSTLSRIDGVFGIQPWQLTHLVIPPFGTLIIDRMYFGWLVVSQLTLMAVLFIPRFRSQRGQVLLTFVISWLVLGVFLAAAIPSVGPCFYGRLYHPDVYAPLLRQLGMINSTHHLTALRIQDALWFDHTRHVTAVGSGVSAMPSMHVSIATVTAMFLRRIKLASVGAIWLAAIWIGSFHLGWHYAIDGLVSIVGTVLIWNWVSYLLAASQS
jgi:hypothetical protein